MFANSHGSRLIWKHTAIRFGVMSVLTSVFSIGVASASFANSPVEGIRPTAASSWIAQSQPGISLAGTFVAAEAPTTGAVRIITEAGHRYLEIDSAFSTTDQAPDLHVLLDTANVPPSSYSTFNSYINLGKLQKVNGTQRYPIPDVIDISTIKSVVIWCRTANATIGYASLGETRSMTSYTLAEGNDYPKKASDIVDNNS